LWVIVEQHLSPIAKSDQRAAKSQKINN
jgi:hypothetical protein